jgi:ABC-type siderophore export system fused ATPase/permease subunit
MDAIAGFMSENGVIVLFIILAAVGLLWLLSRFFKLTIVIAAVVLVFFAFQHFMPSGDLKTKFKEVTDKVTAKAGEVVGSAKEFFSDQKGKMQKHMNEAADNGEKKDTGTGSKKK